MFQHPVLKKESQKREAAGLGHTVELRSLRKGKRLAWDTQWSSDSSRFQAPLSLVPALAQRYRFPCGRHMRQNSPLQVVEA